MRDLPALDSGTLMGLRYLGIDEVARAKRQNYLTIVYDLDSGDLVWVVEGWGKTGLLAFFDRLDEPVVQGVEAFAMDMWALFQTAAREALSFAGIVFDRFHAMQRCTKVIDSPRRAEFKRHPSRIKPAGSMPCWRPMPR